MKTTIIIPTMNRSDFLIRLLQYYLSVGFDGYLCIGDSSNSEHLEPAKKAIEAYKDKLNIIYREYPNLNDSECIQQLIDLAPTPYLAFLADDDFLVPSALDKCVRFLEEHPDYSSAHGKGVVVMLDTGGVYGKVTSVSHYEQPEVENERASDRLLAHMRNYTVTLFSVQRAETWRNVYRNITDLTDKRFTELLPCCLSIIEGKAKELDCLYLVRQGHYRRYLLPTKEEWIAGPNYNNSYMVFRDCLAEALAQQDEISSDESERIVEQAFSLYLANSFVKPLISRFGIPQLLRVGRVIPGARQVWRMSRWLLRSVKLVGQEEIPVGNLFDPASAYREDFLPVYRSVTGTGD